MVKEKKSAIGKIWVKMSRVVPLSWKKTRLAKVAIEKSQPLTKKNFKKVHPLTKTQIQEQPDPSKYVKSSTLDSIALSSDRISRKSINKVEPMANTGEDFRRKDELKIGKNCIKEVDVLFEKEFTLSESKTNSNKKIGQSQIKGAAFPSKAKKRSEQSPKVKKQDSKDAWKLWDDLPSVKSEKYTEDNPLLSEESYELNESDITFSDSEGSELSQLEDDEWVNLNFKIRIKQKGFNTSFKKIINFSKIKQFKKITKKIKVGGLTKLTKNPYLGDMVRTPAESREIDNVLEDNQNHIYQSINRI